jgi:hypothetical protein
MLEPKKEERQAFYDADGDFNFETKIQYQISSLGHPGELNSSAKCQH